MVFTALGMLTKQTSVQHPFGNAADGFGNAVDVEVAYAPDAIHRSSVH